MYCFSGPRSPFIALSCDTKAGPSKHFFAHWHNAKLCHRGWQKDAGGEESFGVVSMPSSPFSLQCHQHVGTRWCSVTQQASAALLQQPPSQFSCCPEASRPLLGSCLEGSPCDLVISQGASLASQQGVSAHRPAAPQPASPLSPCVSVPRALCLSQRVSRCSIRYFYVPWNSLYLLVVNP